MKQSQSPKSRPRTDVTLEGRTQAPAKSGNPLKLFFEVERELLGRARSGDMNGAREILNNLLGMIYFSNGLKIDMLKVRVMELIVLLSRLAVENGALPEEMLEENVAHISELLSIASHEDLSGWTVGVLDTFLEKAVKLDLQPPGDRIERVLAFIDENLDRRLTVHDAAAVSFLSPSRFSHLFSERVGIPFRSYCLRKKIEYSESLLHETQRSIADIAAQLAFADQSHFSRAFKRTVGMTPQEFRRRSSDDLRLRLDRFRRKLAGAGFEPATSGL